MPARFKARPQLIEEGHPDAILVDKFLQLAKTHLSPWTHRSYKRVLETFAQWLGVHNLDLRKLRSEDVDAFLAQWQGRSAARSYGVIVQRFLNFLGLNNGRSLSVDVPHHTRNREEEIRRQLISEDDLDKFLNVCTKEDPQTALMAAALWETGLRIHELVSLRWGDVDFNERQFLLATQKGGGKGRRDFGPKTYSLLMVLMGPGREPTEPLFTSRSPAFYKQAITEDGIRYRIRQYGRLAGWHREQLHPHAFRHSFATMMIATKGANPAQVQQMLGHHDIKTTQIYIHLAESDARDEYRRTMWPGWQPDKPAPTLDLCPSCGAVRLAGRPRCMNCGYDYTQQVQKALEDRLRQEYEAKMQELLKAVEKIEAEALQEKRKFIEDMNKDTKEHNRIIDERLNEIRQTIRETLPKEQKWLDEVVKPMLAKDPERAKDLLEARVAMHELEKAYWADDEQAGVAGQKLSKAVTQRMDARPPTKVKKRNARK